MSDRPPSRLFTTFGTVLYVDASGELRHGSIESSPANALLVAHTSGEAVWLTAKDGDARRVIVCSDERCQVSSSDVSEPFEREVALELLPLERGLIALRAAGRFLCADPDGRVSLSRPACSTWECYLASQRWCGELTSGDAMSIDGAAAANIDRLAIKKFVIDPRLRAHTGARDYKAKILVFGYPQWSHGRVYYDVSRILYQSGYLIDIINWQIDHASYMGEVLQYYDFVMTSPDGVVNLANHYGVAFDRMIVVSHHEMDIRMLVEQKGCEIFSEFANYGAVSDFVYCASLIQGVRRAPRVTPLGVDFSEFYSELPEKLHRVGYASSMALSTFGVDWKRGHLAETAAKGADLEFHVAGSTGSQTSFHEMPQFYRSVDAVLSSSISEGGPLPVMEAAAAGRLVIGTPVGHYPLKAYQGGGMLAPVEPEKFVSFVSEILLHFKSRPDEFVEKCRSIRDAARKFDWQYSIDAWADLIGGA
jgi:hypothetical protein